VSAARNGQVSRPGALEDAGDEIAGAGPKDLLQVRANRTSGPPSRTRKSYSYSAGIRRSAGVVEHRACGLKRGERVGHHQDRVGRLAGHGSRKHAGKIVRLAQAERLDCCSRSTVPNWPTTS